MLTWIENYDQLKKANIEHEKSYVLAFLGAFSDAARRARPQLEEFASEAEEVPVFAVDVEQADGLHKDFGITEVPTVMAVEKGEIKKCVKGVHSSRFYKMHFGGNSSSRSTKDGKRDARNVVVYSSPGCPACTQVKNYLRRHGISYQTVDISRDEKAARKITQRSGQMAVPQTDIDGTLVVGFNQGKLNKLLGIQEEH